MKIHIILEDQDITSERLEALKKFMPEATKIAPEIKTPREIAPEIKPLQEIPPEIAREPEAPRKIKKTDVKALALKLSKAGRQKELAEIFAKFGKENLSGFDETPELYPELFAELEKAVSNG